jgi:hypothetical protein
LIFKEFKLSSWTSHLSYFQKEDKQGDHDHQEDTCEDKTCSVSKQFIAQISPRFGKVGQRQEITIRHKDGTKT